ncbi:MAG: hypothetical protein CMK59_02030 [Proteobacteria bacterium]|nr:hypothetical protein [Pseudomonadota bacterium]
MIEILNSILKERIEQVKELPEESIFADPEQPVGIVVSTGIALAGKSSFLLYQLKRILEEGVSEDDILYIVCSDVRFHRMSYQLLEQIFAVYLSTRVSLQTSKKYVFIENLPVLSAFGTFVEHLLEHHGVELYVSASSAEVIDFLSDEIIEEQLQLFETFPYSFQDFLMHRGVVFWETLTKQSSFLIEQSFETYKQKGGFPHLVDVSQEVRRTSLQQNFEKVLFKDVIDAHDLSHPRALLDLAYFLLNQSASFHSINRLTQVLKNLGHKAPKGVVADYMLWLEDAFLFFSVQVYGESKARAKTNLKKIYCVDHGFIGALSVEDLSNDQILEQVVFLELRRTTTDIFYIKGKGGKVVDFYVFWPDSRMLIHICSSFKGRGKKKRLITFLKDVMLKHSIEKCVVVTQEEEENIQTEVGTIQIVSAWRFLLDIEPYKEDLELEEDETVREEVSNEDIRKEDVEMQRAEESRREEKREKQIKEEQINEALKKDDPAKINNDNLKEDIEKDQKYLKQEQSKPENKNQLLKSFLSDTAKLVSSSFEYSVIAAGSFVMGENDASHEVDLTHDFFMMKTCVTQKLYKEITGQNPSYFTGEECPVEQVNWHEALLFCNALSQKEGLKPCYTISNEQVFLDWEANGWRLPTEAEWEYAARAGANSIYAGADNVEDVSWFNGNSEGRTHPVGRKKPNNWGLFDMSGNVYEWCWDWYSEDYYTLPESRLNPIGPIWGTERILRGGCWANGSKNSQVARRSISNPLSRNYAIGFRAARRPY